MSGKEVLEKALQLEPEERYQIVEGILKSLDEPNQNIDEVWAEEAEKRLHTYHEGRLKGIPFEEVFKEEN